MDQKQKVDAAIEAHTKWITRLRVAIDNGTSEFQPAVVKTDNACEFGKWLYADFPAALKGSPLFNEIRDLHATFHANAGRILEQALAGKKAEAMKDLDSDSAFRKSSLRLIGLLKTLKEQV